MAYLRAGSTAPLGVAKPKGFFIARENQGELR